MHFPLPQLIHDDVAGEYQQRLRHLEKSLLDALNDVKGRILDDDSIITHLEKLKKEAADIARKVEETDHVMAEVERVSQQYEPVAQSCSSICFTLEALNQVTPRTIYMYSTCTCTFQCVVFLLTSF